MYFLKLSQGVLYEALFSFYNSYKNPTATPLGFTLTDKETIRIKLYKGSKTYEELTNNRPDIVINLTNNPKLFLIFSFKKIFKEYIDNIRFVDSLKVKAPKIAPENEIYGYIECKIEEIERMDNYSKITLSIEDIDIASPYVTLEPLSRVHNHMIDIAVYLTKLASIKEVEESQKYLNLLKYSLHIVRDYCISDTCKEYLEMVRKVLESLGIYGRDIMELESR